MAPNPRLRSPRHHRGITLTCGTTTSQWKRSIHVNPSLSTDPALPTLSHSVPQLLILTSSLAKDVRLLHLSHQVTWCSVWIFKHQLPLASVFLPQPSQAKVSISCEAEMSSPGAASSISCRIFEQTFAPNFKFHSGGKTTRTFLATNRFKTSSAHSLLLPTLAQQAPCQGRDAKS